MPAPSLRLASSKSRSVNRDARRNLGRSGPHRCCHADRCRPHANGPATPESATAGFSAVAAF